jgi:hypothetical protein
MEKSEKGCHYNFKESAIYKWNATVTRSLNLIIIGTILLLVAFYFSEVKRAVFLWGSYPVLCYLWLIYHSVFNSISCIQEEAEIRSNPINVKAKTDIDCKIVDLYLNNNNYVSNYKLRNTLNGLWFKRINRSGLYFYAIFSLIPLALSFLYIHNENSLVLVILNFANSMPIEFTIATCILGLIVMTFFKSKYIENITFWDKYVIVSYENIINDKNCGERESYYRPLTFEGEKLGDYSGILAYTMFATGLWLFAIIVSLFEVMPFGSSKEGSMYYKQGALTNLLISIAFGIVVFVVNLMVLDGVPLADSVYDIVTSTLERIISFQI